jgi:hypothetical protein
MTFVWETSKIGKLPVDLAVFESLKGRIVLNAAAINSIGTGSGSSGVHWLAVNTAERLGQRPDELTTADVWMLVGALIKQNLLGWSSDTTGDPLVSGYVFHPDQVEMIRHD